MRSGAHQNQLKMMFFCRKSVGYDKLFRVSGFVLRPYLQTLLKEKIDKNDLYDENKLNHESLKT